MVGVLILAFVVMLLSFTSTRYDQHTGQFQRDPRPSGDSSTTQSAQLAQPQAGGVAEAFEPAKPDIPEWVFLSKSSDKELSTLLRKAARQVQKSPDCLEVTQALIDRAQSKPGRPVFWVTCRVNRPAPFDAENFFITKEEIERDVIIRLPPPVDKYAAIDVCKQYVRRQAKFASSVNFSLLGTRSSQAPNGNAKVILDFTAKNEFGAELPYRAECRFTTDGKSEASIDPR